MIHFQNDVLLYLIDNNLNADGAPIINIGDLILFSEEPDSSKTYVAYETFFKSIDMYFEYTEHGTAKNRTIKITGMLTGFQSL